MKGSKFVSQQQVLPEYEMQRFEKMKQNAILFDARGHGKESLANKIFQAKADIQYQNVREEEMYSDDDDDEMYMPLEDDLGEDDGDCHENEMFEQPIQKKPPKTMSAFVPKQVKQPHNIEADTPIRPRTRSGSMAESVKHVVQSQQKLTTTATHPKKQQLIQKNKSSQPQKQLQARTTKASASASSNNSSQPQPQKLQQQQKFCAAGSLFRFVELRKQKLRNSVSPKDIDIPQNNVEVADDHLSNHTPNGESQLSNHPANEAREIEPEHAIVVAATQNIAPQTEEQSRRDESAEPSKTKRHRGPTKLPRIHARTSEERVLIVQNSFGQPIGPTDEIVIEFRGFLGTIARNSKLAPLDFCDWPSVPTHNDIWSYILERYIVAEEGRKHILKNVGTRWRNYKCWVKKNHYYRYDTYDKRWENRPPTISDDQFKHLLHFWDCQLVEEISKQNKCNQEKADDLHTLGPNSYALLRHHLQKKDPNKEEPSLAKVYMESRTRNPKRKYKTSYQKTKDNMEKMKALTAQQNEQGATYKDPYYEVIKKPEHNGRVRLYGLGVSKSVLKKRGNNSNFVLPQVFLEGIEKDYVKKLHQLNPGMKFVLPDSFGGKRDASTPDGGPSIRADSSNQDVNEANGENEPQDVQIEHS